MTVFLQFVLDAKSQEVQNLKTVSSDGEQQQQLPSSSASVASLIPFLQDAIGKLQDEQISAAFDFILTNEVGSVQYAACKLYLLDDSHLAQVQCLVSYSPLPSSIHQHLRLNSEKLCDVRALQQLDCITETQSLKAASDGLQYLRRIPPQLFIKYLLAPLLLEQSAVVISKECPITLVRTLLSLHGLLMGQSSTIFIPYLPDQMLDVIHSPTPYVIGYFINRQLQQQQNIELESPEDVTVFDLDSMEGIQIGQTAVQLPSQEYLLADLERLWYGPQECPCGFEHSKIQASRFNAHEKLQSNMRSVIIGWYCRIFKTLPLCLLRTKNNYRFDHLRFLNGVADDLRHIYSKLIETSAFHQMVDLLCRIKLCFDQVQIQEDFIGGISVVLKAGIELENSVMSLHLTMTLLQIQCPVVCSTFDDIFFGEQCTDILVDKMVRVISGQEFINSKCCDSLLKLCSNDHQRRQLLSTSVQVIVNGDHSYNADSTDLLQCLKVAEMIKFLTNVQLSYPDYLSLLPASEQQYLLVIFSKLDSKRIQSVEQLAFGKDKSVQNDKFVLNCNPVTSLNSTDSLDESTQNDIPSYMQKFIDRPLELTAHIVGMVSNMIKVLSLQSNHSTGSSGDIFKDSGNSSLNDLSASNNPLSNLVSRRASSQVKGSSAAGSDNQRKKSVFASFLPEGDSLDSLSLSEDTRMQYFILSQSSMLRMVKKMPAYEDFKRLIVILRHINLQHLRTDSDKLAFWLNIRNSLIIQAVIEFGVPMNEQHYINFSCEKPCYIISDSSYSVNEITYGILKARCPIPKALSGHQQQSSGSSAVQQLTQVTVFTHSHSHSRASTTGGSSSVSGATGAGQDLGSVLQHKSSDSTTSGGKLKPMLEADIKMKSANEMDQYVNRPAALHLRITASDPRSSYLLLDSYPSVNFCLVDCTSTGSPLICFKAEQVLAMITQQAVSYINSKILLTSECKKQFTPLKKQQKVIVVKIPKFIMNQMKDFGGASNAEQLLKYFIAAYPQCHLAATLLKEKVVVRQGLLSSATASSAKSLAPQYMHDKLVVQRMEQLQLDTSRLKIEDYEESRFMLQVPIDRNVTSSSRDLLNVQ
ncbi:hypothetical protein MIR68_010740 [Amoeboaphelidium protococcarum]|nr:hypothetical protein MIR68_010740 [Amoeboaphelidium protococcarum]